MQRLRLARSVRAAVAVEVFQVFRLPPPRGEPGEERVASPLLPAGSCRTAGIEEMGMHRSRLSVVACNRRPRVETAAPLTAVVYPQGHTASPERRGRQGIRLTTGSEACGREASRRAGKARPVPLTRYHLLRDSCCYLDRDTRRGPRTRVSAVIARRSAHMFFIAYPQTRVPAPSVPGPYAGTAGAGPNPLSIAQNPGLSQSTNLYPISPDPEFLGPGESISDNTLFHVSSSSSRHAPART